jgi:hypothetical protein
MVFRVRIAVKGRSGSSLKSAHFEEILGCVSLNATMWPWVVESKTASKMLQIKDAVIASIAYEKISVYSLKFGAS